MKDAPGWGLTSGERHAVLLICAATLIGIGYRLYQQSGIPESPAITAQDSAAIEAITRALEPGSRSAVEGTDEDGIAATDSLKIPRQANSSDPIDLNRATQEQLEDLPGIGPVLAQRILETRGQLGGFQQIEELLEVPGIGPRRLDKIRGSVSCGSSKSSSENHPQ